MSATAVGSPFPAAAAVAQRRRRAVQARCSSAVAAPILDDLRLRCATPLPLLRHVADAMAADMRAGLAADGAAELKMIPSYVYSLPTGDETGLFYALDLGGTNFRVLRVQLGGKDRRVVDSESEQVSIPKEIMHGTTEELFDFIAARLSSFVATEGGNFRLQEGRKREIGFTFSFPVKQTSIDSGILIKWTKGFAVSGTAGKDVVACLNAAMERQGLDMRVSALVNDTVGTLAGAHYWDEDVMVAVILGTGTNACYIERSDSIPKLQHLGLVTGNTIINTEWGAFSDGLPLTEFDRDMDAESINPGEQIFEKTISGMYLGEIVRRVLAKMAQESDLFGHSFADKLAEPFVLRTPHLCAMQQDGSNDLGEVELILRDVVGVNRSSLAARRAIVEVSDCIVKRGGRLAGAGIAGILQKMESDSSGMVLGRRTAGGDGWWALRELPPVQVVYDRGYGGASRSPGLGARRCRAHERRLRDRRGAFGRRELEICGQVIDLKVLRNPQSGEVAARNLERGFQKCMFVPRNVSHQQVLYYIIHRSKQIIVKMVKHGICNYGHMSLW